MDQQMRDFLEFAGLGDIEDVVAPVMQVVAGAADRAQRGVAGDDARQGDRFFGGGFGVVIASFLSYVRLRAVATL